MANKTIQALLADRDLKTVAEATKFTQKRLKELLDPASTLTAAEAQTLGGYFEVSAKSLLTAQMNVHLAILEGTLPSPNTSAKTTRSSTRTTHSSARAVGKCDVSMY